MKLRNLTIAACLGCLYPISIWAQVTTDMAQCVELARVIAAPKYLNVSTARLQAMRYYALCEDHSEADKTAISIGFSAFNLGVSLSEDERKAFCEQSRTYIVSNTLDYQFGASLFQASLPTIQMCMSAIDDGWKIRSRRIGDDAFSLSISHGGSGDVLQAIDILPTSNSLTCDGMPASLPVTVTEVAPVTLTCRREPTKIMVNGVEIRSSEEASLNLRFGTGPLPITLPAYSGSVLDAIYRDINDLRGDVVELGDKIEALQGPSTALQGGNVDYKEIEAGVPSGAYCDSGKVMVGLYWSTQQQKIWFRCARPLGPRE